MPVLRAIVSVKATKGGSGSSGVARYIAGVKRDEEREGRGPRPLFNGKAREKLNPELKGTLSDAKAPHAKISDRNGSGTRRRDKPPYER